MRSRSLAWQTRCLLEPLRRPRRAAGAPTHVFLCVADHYEPKWRGASDAVARDRVRRWVDAYPKAFGDFRDADGRPPRHSFFYPIEEYEPELLDELAELCRAGFGEVEVHLHHHDDTADNLRRSLLSFKALLAERHGLLATDNATGELAYGFIHGNWALDNSLPDGRWCGVNNELDVLRETGCYADFTFPSAPDPSQPRTLNRIYYAVDDPERPKSHDTGVRVGAAPRPDRALMLIQGPLLPDWSRRKRGIVPGLENGCLQANHPASIERFDLWVKARVHVPTRPDWVFVKLHAHGANEAGQQALLGASMVRFHEELARRADRDPNFSYHYVTAREMYNLAKAAEAGWTGPVAGARDFALTSNLDAAALPTQESHDTCPP